MSDYTIVYVLMICAGLLLGYWYWTKRDQKQTPPPPFPTPSPTPKPTPPPPQPVHVELAKEIRCIYSYSRSADLAMRGVWVCRNCELENSSLNDNCELCGEPKAFI